MEEMDIVIVGGGIAGLATSLALHRKGIKSVVLERAESLRSEGAALGIQTNGWRALEQLGVADQLRLSSLPFYQIRSVLIEKGKRHESVAPASYGEARCVKRNDLIEVLANALPRGTIQFGCQIVSVKLHETTSFPVIQIMNGKTINAKVLIGCDGANSVVAEFLRLNPIKSLETHAIRGLTNYPNGHGFQTECVRIKTDNVLCGRLPITQNFVFWFSIIQNYSGESKIFKNRERVAKLALESINELSKEWKEMVEKCDTSSLYMSKLRYRTPVEMLFGRFRRGTVTVAGDAMHLMGPFLGQGGSAALEDAIVLARCLATKYEESHNALARQMEEAIDDYVKERRIRLVALSMQTYLTGLCIKTSSRALKSILIVLLMILFFDQIHHTRYNCGRL